MLSRKLENLTESLRHFIDPETCTMVLPCRIVPTVFEALTAAVDVAKAMEAAPLELRPAATVSRLDEARRRRRQLRLVTGGDAA